MPLGVKPQQWWCVIGEALKWCARVPVAIGVVVGAACLSFISIMCVIRVTQFVYRRWLAHPW